MALAREHRPTYWEWRAELEHARDRLRLTVWALGLGCLVLTGLVVWQALRPQPVYYITGTVGRAWPGQVPDAVVEDFAGRVAALLGNLTPTTARRVYELAARYLTSALASRLAIEAKSDFEAIEAQRLGVAFTQTGVAMVERAEDPPAWRLVVTGTRTAWAGQQLLSQDPVEYRVRVVRVPATDLNPWGLAVESLRLERLSRESRGG